MAVEQASALAQFLKKVPVFQYANLDVLEEIAAQSEEKHYQPGELILKQGHNNDSYFFLRSGRVAAHVERLTARETVATLDPPTIFGELSCITGKPCSADIEVVYESVVIVIPKQVLDSAGQKHPEILRGSLRMLAGRLHHAVINPRVAEFPVVLLRQHPHWEAPRSFSEGLAKSLAQQIGKQALLVRIDSDNRDDGERDDGEIQELGQDAFVVDWPGDGQLLKKLVVQVPLWQERFKTIILHPTGSDRHSVAGRIGDVVTEFGDLLGPGDPLPEDDGQKKHFILGSGENPILPILNGSRQLLFDAAESESNYREGNPVTARFRHTVGSIARHILDVQIGLACGGGAAWGFTHVGVFKVLAEAGVPIDVMAGNSAGTLVGGMRCCGRTPDEIRDHILELTKSRLRLFNLWFWKLHLISESTVMKNFQKFYGDIHVNQIEIPFWANALNIETGEEVNITNGPLRAAVRASVCLPGLFPPIVHDDALLIDAGMIDSVPVNQIREMGCRFAIATNVMQDLKTQTISRKYPRNLFPIFYRALQVCGHEIGAARCERASDVVIQPDAGDITMLGFHHVDELIAAGEKAARQQLPLIQAAYSRLKARC